VLVSTHYMDEAERCHRIHYISYGKLLASGTIDEVVARAGLHTFVLEGPEAARAAHMLQGKPGVDQVAPFGASVHIVGEDRDALQQAVNAAVQATGVAAHEGRTNLEDVFIHFMRGSKDNIQ
jgi:ABC-2 type transport system ATP-binding protein